MMTVCFNYSRYRAILILIIFPLVSSAQINNADSLKNLLPARADTSTITLLSNISKSFLSIDSDSALRYSERAVDLSKGLKYREGEVRSLIHLSSIHRHRLDYKSAIAVANNAISLAEEMNNDQLIAASRINLAVCHAEFNNQAGALREFEKSLKYFRKAGNASGAVLHAITLANIFLAHNDFTNADYYYGIARDLATDDEFLKNLVLVNQAEALLKQNKNEPAIALLADAERFFEVNGNKSFLSRVFLLKGDIENAANNYDEALLLYSKAYSVNPPADITQRARILVSLGNVSQKQNQLENSKKYYQDAFALTDPTDYARLGQIYDGLGKYFTHKEDFKQAYESKLKYELSRDSVNAINQRKKLRQLQIQYEVDEAEKEVAALSAENKSKNQIIILLVLLIITTSIIVLLIIRKQKAKIISTEKGREDLEQEIKSKDESEQQLKNELEFKIKELTSFTLNMIQKKEMLENLKSEIETIREKADGESRAQLNKIISTINFSQHLDRDWDNFRLYFEQVHQGFFNNLQTQFPDLNANDLRLCALIKLNLDTKQIASVMDISPESAKVAKHRIRKKLRLSASDNIMSLFASISSSAKHQRGLE
jgi:tetratricopeptide (TPR) repeat protein